MATSCVSLVEELLRLLLRPLQVGVGGRRKRFEELLEEQLSVEEQRLKSARQQQVRGHHQGLLGSQWRVEAHTVSSLRATPTPRGPS